MRIALRIYLSYVVLSMVLGGATLVAATWSLQQLVSGIVTEAAVEMGRELGLFLTSSGGRSLDELTPQQARVLDDQLRAYALRSERVETLLIVDNDCVIRFSSDPSAVGKTFRGGEERAILLSNQPTVRTISRPGGPLREITVPIRSLVGGRIGALRVQVIPQYFTRFLDEPRKRFLWIFGAMVLFITASGVALASLLTIPVRRLNRTLLELQRGDEASVEVDERSDFAPTLRVVRGLADRLETMAASSRSSEMLLATITQALEQGVVVLDASGRVVTVNDAALRMLGCQTGAGGIEEASRVLSADLNLSRVLAEQPAGEMRPFDLPEPPGGSRAGLRVSPTALKEEGKVAGAMLLLRDLESVRTLEQHLQEAGRLSLLVRLTSTVAHEIKNPLNSMVINVEALRSVLSSVPVENRPECEKYLEVIVREIYHLDEVIRDYLGLAASGEREGAMADVREVVENVVELIRFEANQSRVRLALDLDSELPSVPVPAVRLKQALLNLCLNAIQAMEKGGSLTVRARAEEGSVFVEVSDTGPGIPNGIRSSIFDFHFTTKRGGSGLGLPIARMIVEAAGGAIDFDSEPGRGTTFRLRFPAAREAQAAGAGGGK